MTTRPLHSTKSEGTPENGLSARAYRLVWACLSVMLVLSGIVLVLFGISWWAAITVVLLLCCPAAMAVGIYMSFRPQRRPSILSKER